MKITEVDRGGRIFYLPICETHGELVDCTTVVAAEAFRDRHIANEHMTEESTILPDPANSMVNSGTNLSAMPTKERLDLLEAGVEVAREQQHYGKVAGIKNCIEGYRLHMLDSKSLRDAAQDALDYLDEMAPGWSRPIGKLPTPKQIRSALATELAKSRED